MIAAIVVPFRADSIFSTADCLEDEAAGAPDNVGFGAAAAASFGRPGTLLLLRCFAARRGLSRAFAVFGFDFRMTGTPGGSTTASCAAIDKAPPAERGEGDVSRLFAGEPMEQRDGILQTPDLIDQLFDLHRNRHGLSDAPRARTSFRGVCDPCASTAHCWRDRGAIHEAVLPRPHTLRTRGKSSAIPSNFMALFEPLEHLVTGRHSSGG
jgi:hypothetical protein